MEIVEFVSPIIFYLGLVVEYIGLIIVVASVFIALAMLPMKKYTMENIRVRLAKRIIFGLEFIIVADILLVTVATTFDDIIQLGVIVFIRVLLGYALRKEIAAKI